MRIPVGPPISEMPRLTKRAGASWIEHRYAPRRECEFQLAASTGQQVCRGFTRDLSSGGAAAFLSDEFAIGDRLILKMSLAPDNFVVEIPAVVRRRIGFRYGIEFCAPDPQLMEAVDRALAQRPS